MREEQLWHCDYSDPQSKAGCHLTSCFYCKEKFHRLLASSFEENRLTAWTFNQPPWKQWWADWGQKWINKALIPGAGGFSHKRVSGDRCVRCRSGRLPWLHLLLHHRHDLLGSTLHGSCGSGTVWLHSLQSSRSVCLFEDHSAYNPWPSGSPDPGLSKEQPLGYFPHPRDWTGGILLGRLVPGSCSCPSHEVPAMPIVSASPSDTQLTFPISHPAPTREESSPKETEPTLNAAQNVSATRLKLYLLHKKNTR